MRYAGVRGAGADGGVVGRRSAGDIGVELDCTHGGCRDSELDAAIASGVGVETSHHDVVSSQWGRPLTQRRPSQENNVTISIITTTTSTITIDASSRQFIHIRYCIRGNLILFPAFIP